MGAESVAYHRETVLGRGDDYPRQALAYYAERGESPLAWGGSGAVALGLEGPVTEAQYDAVYGPGGASDPTTGQRLVSAKRPGLELVVAAHKSVALLGLAGRAEDMHAILDAETDGTLGYLDDWMSERGGRRGRAQLRTPTEGLLYARTRHATSRAADPEPHDHVLIANACRMADNAGGYKAVDTAALRDLLHAATAAGRVASAAKATELGYAIGADGGPSGKLGHWAISGVPKEACELFSKRSAEITAATESKGYSTYQARGVAARDTRKAKRHTPVEELTGRWTSELASAGLTPESLLAGIEAAAAGRTPPPPRLSSPELAVLVKDTLGPEGALAARKVFTRGDVMVATGPALFGRDPAELARVADAVCASPQAVALIGVTGAREHAYAPACVLAREAAIDTLVLGQAKRADAPSVSLPAVHAAIATKEQSKRNGRVLPCRPRDAKKVCEHGVRLGCSVRHKDGDPRVGQPICAQCFDYQGQVVWNALAPALWKRTTVYLPRVLARMAGLTKKEFDALVKVRFSKVAEYQRRGAIHFHAVIRLDAAPPESNPEAVAPPPERFTAELLEEALRATRDLVAIDCPESAVLGREDTTIRWGSEMDVRPIRSSGTGEMTAEVVAAYVAKYATKFSEGMGLPDRPIESDADVEDLDAPEHIKGLVRAAWMLGWKQQLADLKLREHAHGLGFGGHYLTKSRRYSTTMGALRQVRRDFARRMREGEDGVVVDAWGRPEGDDQAAKESEWNYLGWGYRTIGEAYLASSAAARAREERRVGREELKCRAA